MKKKTRTYRVSEPKLGKLEAKYVSAALESTQISGFGEFVDEAEQLICEMTGASYSLVTCNGTASLHLALMTLGLGPGDEVIVPSLTYIAAVNAIIYVGATPVLVDCSLDFWVIDAHRVREAITPRTRAVLAVHIYGHPFNYELLRQITAESNLFLIEDAAEAPLSTSQNRTAGQMGDVSSFSFFANKVIAAGEGGAITTNSRELYERAKIIRNQGMSTARRFEHNVVGNNFRLNNISAAILVAQLQSRHHLAQSRMDVALQYESLISSRGIFTTQAIAPWATWTPWLFSLLVPQTPTRDSRDHLANQLAEVGIETRPFFIPAHRMTPYKDYASLMANFSASDVISNRGLNLPTSALMKKGDVRYVVDWLYKKWEDAPRHNQNRTNPGSWRP